MRETRVGFIVPAILCCLCTQGASQATAGQEQYAPLPTVRCQADRIEKPAYAASPLILRGHAEVVFPTFRLLAEKIEMTLPDPTAPHPAGTIAVTAEDGVTLRLGSQELGFRGLIFRIDVPK